MERETNPQEVVQVLSEQEEVDRDLNLWQMERSWRASQKQRTEVEWLNIFPEAKKRWGRLIKGEIKIRLKYLKLALDKLPAETRQEILANPTESRWRDDLIKEAHDRKKQSLEKSIHFWIAELDLYNWIGKKPEEIKERENKIVITEEMIERAREYPLDKLIDINRQGFTRCFGHKDQHPSAYCKKNFIHCFVCNKSWDTIQVLVDRDGLTFRQAVLQLQ